MRRCSGFDIPEDPSRNWNSPENPGMDSRGTLGCLPVSQPKDQRSLKALGRPRNHLGEFWGCPRPFKSACQTLAVLMRRQQGCLELPHCGSGWQPKLQSRLGWLFATGHTARQLAVHPAQRKQPKLACGRICARIWHSD